MITIETAPEAWRLHATGSLMTKVHGRRRTHLVLARVMVAAMLTLDPGLASAQTLSEAETLAELCESNFNRGAYRDAVTACNQSLAISLPLANSSQRLGMEKFKAGQYRAALAEFEAVQQIWIPLSKGFMLRGIAYGMLGEPARTRNATREATASSFLLAEAFINAGKAQVALGDRAGATRSFTEALENNQGALQAFKDNSEAAVAGRGNFLRGIAKMALADLGSPRGDRKEACTAFKKAATLGYEPAVQWLASDDGSWCRVGSAGHQP